MGLDGKWLIAVVVLSQIKSNYGATTPMSPSSVNQIATSPQTVSATVLNNVTTEGQRAPIPTSKAPVSTANTTSPWPNRTVHLQTTKAPNENTTMNSGTTVPVRGLPISTASTKTLTLVNNKPKNVSTSMNGMTPTPAKAVSSKSQVSTTPEAQNTSITSEMTMTNQTTTTESDVSNLSTEVSTTSISTNESTGNSSSSTISASTEALPNSQTSVSSKTDTAFSSNTNPSSTIMSNTPKRVSVTPGASKDDSDSGESFDKEVVIIFSVAGGLIVIVIVTACVIKTRRKKHQESFIVGSNTIEIKSSQF